MAVYALKRIIFICSVLLTGSCAMTANTNTKPEKLNYTRTAENLNWNHPRPGKALPKIKVYAERQPYYPAQNFLNCWIDRPLFEDVSLRKGNVGKNGFLKDVEIAKSYGLDGFAAIAYESMHRAHLKYLQEENIKNYEHAYIICSGEISSNYYKRMRNMMIDAGKAPHTARINGKMVCWNYGSSSPQSLALLRKFITKLRADAEVPPFLIIAQLPFLELYNTVNKKTSSGQEVSKEDIEQFRAKVRDALTVYDGLQLRCFEFYSNNMQGEYPIHALPTDLWGKYILPVLREEFAKPEHKGKLLGLYAKQAYINHLRGTTIGQYGTEHIRTFLGEAAKISPDMIMLFEWNEANENTSFQPTVSSGRTLERLVAYARSCYDGTRPTPRPGDDVSIPNLVLSVPQCIRIGEILHLELLNIPDGTFSGEIQALLRLLDGEGKTLCLLPMEKIDASGLRVVTWRFPAEQFANVQSINYELEIRHNGKTAVYKNFDATRINPTSNTHYLYSRMPLREALMPKNWTLHAAPQKDGSYLVDATFECEEDLASLEILDSPQELYSLDRTHEFDPDKEAVFRGRYTTLRRMGKLSGRLSVPGSTGWHLRSLHAAWEQFASGLMVNHEMRVNNLFADGSSNFLLGVPLSELKKNLSFVMNYKGFPPISFDLTQVLKEGRQAKLLANNVMVELYRSDTLADYPPHLNAKRGKIHTVIRPLTKFPQIQLRAVTKSGKIFRSPVRSLRSAKGQVEPMIIWSESAKKTVEVSLSSARIPDFNAVFGPEKGLIMATTEAPACCITLGGAWIYRGGSPVYGIQIPGNKILPKDFVCCDPKWIQEDGQWVLRFDGKGNYLVLPREMIPRSAPFTFEFEIKRDTGHNEVLLRTGDFEPCGLEMMIENGILKCAYFYGPSGIFRKFDTELKVPVNVWTKISVIKTVDKITFAVDGKSKTFDFSGRGKFYFQSAFGGHAANSKWISPDSHFFSGMLRKMRVRHNSKKEIECK